FLEAWLCLLHRDAEADELVVPVAFANAKIEPSTRQQVHGRRLLGQQHRVVPGQHDHRGTEAERARSRADPGQQVERRRDLAEAGEMMFHDERALVTQRLGLDDILDVVLEAGGAVYIGAAALCLSRAEKSELHSRTPPPWYHLDLRYHLDLPASLRNNGYPHKRSGSPRSAVQPLAKETPTEISHSARRTLHS